MGYEALVQVQEVNWIIIEYLAAYPLSSWLVLCCSFNPAILARMLILESDAGLGLE